MRKHNIRFSFFCTSNASNEMQKKLSFKQNARSLFFLMRVENADLAGVREKVETMKENLNTMNRQVYKVHVRDLHKKGLHSAHLRDVPEPENIKVVEIAPDHLADDFNKSIGIIARAFFTEDLDFVKEYFEIPPPTIEDYLDIDLAAKKPDKNLALIFH